MPALAIEAPRFSALLHLVFTCVAPGLHPWRLTVGGVSSTGHTVWAWASCWLDAMTNWRLVGRARSDVGGHTMLEISPESRDPEFGLAVLGQFRLLRGLNVVRVPRASQRLLAFLALHDRIVERAALAGALWPEASEPRAYSSLRAALSRLQSTARMALAASQFELGLAQGVTVDIHHATALARRLLDPAVPPVPGDLGTSAVMALSADLLPDWYDDWVLVEAEDWRQLRLHALEALVGHLMAAGRWAEAAGAARSAVRGEPLRETSRAALIRVFLAEGNVSEAVREFRSYRALLQDELGLEPTPRLCRLIQNARNT
jgi:DNA-binding SARP family transcriptional activator